MISKILAMRLSPILETLIDPAQSTFVPNSSMVENIYLVQELLRRYGWSRISLRCIMKIDLRKAYDSQLDFLGGCSIGVLVFLLCLWAGLCNVLQLLHTPFPLMDLYMVFSKVRKVSGKGTLYPLSYLLSV